MFTSEETITLVKIIQGDENYITDKDSKLDVEVVVLKSRIINSTLYKSILNDFGGGGDGDNNKVFFPSAYNDVFESYHHYLKTYYIDSNSIKRCLQLCHYLGDMEYLYHLVQQMLIQWSFNDVKLDIDDLTTNLQHDIYLLCPYQLLPDSLLMTNKFLMLWVKINRDKKFTLYYNNQMKEYFHDIVFTHGTYRYRLDNGNNVRQITPGYKDSTKFYTKHGILRLWYDSGRISEVTNYRCNQRHGLSTGYYDTDNHQLMDKTYYCNDVKHGRHTGWDINNKLIFDWHYHHDVLHGGVKLWWHRYSTKNTSMTNHHCMCKNKYLHGVKHGLQSGYYENGIVKYKITYFRGIKINAKFYSQDGKQILNPIPGEIILNPLDLKYVEYF